MKKIIISTISVSLFLSAFFAVKSVASIDEVGLFNANVEALADGEEAVTGHCEEKDKDCLAFCPKCGADLNQDDCGCDREVVDPRLEVLKDLMMKEKG